MATTGTAIPELLNDMRIYSKGQDDFVGATSIEIGGLSTKTAEITGIGLAGSLDAPVTGHFEGIEATINYQTPIPKAFEITGGKPIELEAYGAIQKFDPSSSALSYSQLKITIKGRGKNYEMGGMEPMNTMDGSNTIEVHYLKYEIDGKEVLEIDKYNYIYKVNGVDLLAEVKSKLAMK